VTSRFVHGTARPRVSPVGAERLIETETDLFPGPITRPLKSRKCAQRRIATLRSQLMAVTRRGIAIHAEELSARRWERFDPQLPRDLVHVSELAHGSESYARAWWGSIEGAARCKGRVLFTKQKRSLQEHLGSEAGNRLTRKSVTSSQKDRQSEQRHLTSLSSLFRTERRENGFQMRSRTLIPLGREPNGGSRPERIQARTVWCGRLVRATFSWCTAFRPARNATPWHGVPRELFLLNRHSQFPEDRAGRLRLRMNAKR